MVFPPFIYLLLKHQVSFFLIHFSIKEINKICSGLQEGRATHGCTLFSVWYDPIDVPPSLRICRGELPMLKDYRLKVLLMV